MKQVQFKLDTIENTLTKGKIYDTHTVYNDNHLAITDDAGDEHLIGNVRNELGTFEGDKCLNERFNYGNAIDPELGKPEPAPKQLRVAHFPQVPCKPFIQPVGSIEEAHAVMNMLANYDLHQYTHNIKGDYANMSVLEEFDEDENEWISWSDEETGIDDIDEYFEFIAECEAEENAQ